MFIDEVPGLLTPYGATEGGRAIEWEDRPGRWVPYRTVPDHFIL